MTFLAASPSNELLGYFHKSLRDRKNDFARLCKNEKIWVMTSLVLAEDPPGEDIYGLDAFALFRGEVIEAKRGLERQVCLQVDGEVLIEVLLGP
jgi:hypothetical protein